MDFDESLPSDIHFLPEAHVHRISSWTSMESKAKNYSDFSRHDYEDEFDDDLNVSARSSSPPPPPPPPLPEQHTRVVRPESTITKFTPSPKVNEHKTVPNDPLPFHRSSPQVSDPAKFSGSPDISTATPNKSRGSSSSFPFLKRGRLVYFLFETLFSDFLISSLHF
jgi:hypothetical protein